MRCKSFRLNIEVVPAGAGWIQYFPDVEGIVRETAKIALARGVVASGIVWRGLVELSIVLADAAEQRRLNRDYRGKNAPTNVLAFPAWCRGALVPLGAPILLGDVVLALETVAREASEQEKPIADHVRHLVVHGILHLLGYNHDTPPEAVVMELLEKSILAEMGVPDPYRDPMSFVGPAPASHERSRAART